MKVRESSPRHIFYLWLIKVWANERRCYICNIFSYWLRPCSAIDRKQVQSTLNQQKNCLWQHWPHLLSLPYIDRVLVQERCNSSALVMELRLSCTNPSIWWIYLQDQHSAPEFCLTFVDFLSYFVYYLKCPSWLVLLHIIFEKIDTLVMWWLYFLIRFFIQLQ